MMFHMKVWKLFSNHSNIEGKQDDNVYLKEVCDAVVLPKGARPPLRPPAQVTPEIRGGLSGLGRGERLRLLGQRRNVFDEG